MQGNPLWPWHPMARSCPGSSCTFSTLLITANHLIATTLLITTTLTRGDMNGLLKRPGSPTASDSSKENMDEEDNNNMSGLTRYMRRIQ